MQKTVDFGSKAVGLIFAFRMVFPSFLARISVSSEMFLKNQKNLVVDEVADFEKALSF